MKKKKEEKIRLNDKHFTIKMSTVMSCILNRNGQRIFGLWVHGQVANKERSEWKDDFAEGLSGGGAKHLNNVYKLLPHQL